MASSFEDFLNSLKAETSDGDGNAKIGVEPSAEQRQIAGNVYSIFSAYVDAGFTRFEALQLILAHIQGAGGNG